MAVFVLNKRGKPLMPCNEKRARLLLERGRARVIRLAPFTIRLIDRVEGETQPLRIKIDPGSKTTGIALVREAKEKTVVLGLFELIHRGQQISQALLARPALRRARRNRKTRYRAARFLNRSRPKGWLPPSLQHRVHTTLSWIKRFQLLAPISGIAQELAKFDLQLIQNPEISGTEYHQGELAGYELREYLLQKWKRQCAYCSAQNVPLQIDHIKSRAKGGSHRATNLTLACERCNLLKGAQKVEIFLAKQPERLREIQLQAQIPLKDAASMNATRGTLLNTLKKTGLPLETASGGKTKFNRTRFGVPKTHALDAACVGAVTSLANWQKPTMQIKCTGRGAYQRTRLTAKGSIRGYLTRQKSVRGFQTGDRVKAVVLKGVKTGIYVGRVAVRTSGWFNIQTLNGVVQGISHHDCKLIQRNDGYSYQQIKTLKGDAW